MSAPAILRRVPEISVVIRGRDPGPRLLPAPRSVLQQEAVDLERLLVAAAARARRRRQPMRAEDAR